MNTGLITAEGTTLYLFYGIAILAAYFIGNISPAILIGRMSGVDIRKEGSGNAGTTNVLRVLGKKAAVATLAIDVLKGVVAVLLGRLLGGDNLAAYCCFAVLIGHIWPLAFGFRGGKGIATGFGAIVTLQPVIGGLLALIAIVLMALTKRVSVGSIAAAAALPFIAYFLNPEYVSVLLVMAVIVIFKHRSNIKRLLRGEEPKFSFKK